MMASTFIRVCLVLHICNTFSFAETIVPPTIDIAPLIEPWKYSTDIILYTQLELVQASQEWGFFHIINHGISAKLQQNLFTQMDTFFSSPKEIKYKIKRSPTNSRGFADDELTKQLKDAKEILDIGQNHFPNLSVNATRDQMLDGVNMWPEDAHLSQLQPVTEEYYAACLNVSSVLFQSIVSNLCKESLPDTVLHAFDTHSSFLRLNMYPLLDSLIESEVLSDSSDSVKSVKVSDRLGVSRHTDAGVLTLLLQDVTPALEVYSGSKQDFGDGQWVFVDPVPGAITVNTGDMLQVWSNGRYKAPEHRVRASSIVVRYSAPFFYNPAYDTLVEPVKCDGDEKFIPRYSPIRWGDYRTQRFIGDYTDAGEEIQIEVFSK